MYKAKLEFEKQTEKKKKELHGIERKLEDRETNLERANLTEANLEGADLREANLEGVALMGTNLEGAALMGANLEGADLREANLAGVLIATCEQLQQAGTLQAAILSDGTKLPNDDTWREVFEKWCETVETDKDGYIKIVKPSSDDEDTPE